jgi:uncharacterized tellurite resistance protein B-like protein
LVKDRIGVLTEIFLGAAYADNKLVGRERHRITDLVRDLMCSQALPDGLQEHIDTFDPATFDLKSAASNFAHDPPMSRRRLLELVAQVMNADGIYDFAEDDFMRALASELQVPESDFSDLTLQYEVSELRESFDSLRRSSSASPLQPSDAGTRP